MTTKKRNWWRFLIKSLILIAVLVTLLLVSGCQTKKPLELSDFNHGRPVIDLGWTCPHLITPELIRQKAEEQGIKLEE